MAGRHNEGRRWSDEALSIAQALGDAEVEADALTTLGVIESTGDQANAHALFAAARQRAVGVADRRVELRAIYNLAVEGMLGNLGAACGLADDGRPGCAGRSGLSGEWGLSCVGNSVGSTTSSGPGTRASRWSRPFPSS